MFIKNICKESFGFGFDFGLEKKILKSQIYSSYNPCFYNGYICFYKFTLFSSWGYSSHSIGFLYRIKICCSQGTAFFWHRRSCKTHSKMSHKNEWKANTTKEKIWNSCEKRHFARIILWTPQICREITYRFCKTFFFFLVSLVLYFSPDLNSVS